MIRKDKTRVLIDTDIGSDPDDALAIALALKSPGIQIEGITIVNGDVRLKARMAATLVALGGFSGVPVIPGIGVSLLNNRDLYANGEEGCGFVAEDASIHEEHAVDFIIRTVMNNPGEITLIAIGPLTNIAAAFIREPRLASTVKQIYMMGGVTRLGENAAELPSVEYNIRCDPEAASVVFASGANLLMVGLDVTETVLFTRKHLDHLRQTGLALNDVLAGIAEKWMAFIGKDQTPMHDPLALALAIDRSLVQTRRMQVNIQYSHDRNTGSTVAVTSDTGNAEVAFEADADRFMELLITRLSSQR